MIFRERFLNAPRKATGKGLTNIASHYSRACREWVRRGSLRARARGAIPCGDDVGPRDGPTHWRR